MRPLIRTCLAALIALAATAPTSRADIFLDVIVNGNDLTGGPVNFTVLGGPGTGFSPDGSQFTLNADVTLLNAALAGLNIPLVFNSLSAVSNFPTAPGSPATAFLTVTADASYLSNLGSANIQIFATGTDYNFPPGIGTLGSTASATFTNAKLVPQNNETFLSTYNPANAVAPPLAGVFSPLLTLNTTTGNDSKSDTAAPTGVGNVTFPFSLQNLTTAVIGPGTLTTGGQVVPAKIGPFGGSTTLVAVVPEPMSLALVGIGLSTVVVAQARRRRVTA